MHVEAPEIDPIFKYSRIFLHQDSRIYGMWLRCLCSAIGAMPGRDILCDFV